MFNFDPIIEEKLGGGWRTEDLMQIGLIFSEASFNRECRRGVGAFVGAAVASSSLIVPASNCRRYSFPKKVHKVDVDSL